MNHLNDDLIVLGSKDVEGILQNSDFKIVELVKDAYKLHSQGLSLVPQSVFLRFDEMPEARIIGLPAYLKSKTPVAGIKWVSSFPNNINAGLPRASATLILNDLDNGRAFCIMDATRINIVRTAASAYLAIEILSRKPTESMAIIGAGPINRQIISILSSKNDVLKNIYIYDKDLTRANRLADEIRTSELKVVACKSSREACLNTALVSIATSVSKPYINDISIFQPNALILNISLRDLSPQVILKSYNVVDDIEHVNREQTSIHRAYNIEGKTDFIDASISDLIGHKHGFYSPEKPIIFSPFGLGILDIAVAQYVYTQALINNQGIVISNYHNPISN